MGVENKKAARNVMGRIADYLRRMAMARMDVWPRLGYISLTYIGLVEQPLNGW